MTKFIFVHFQTILTEPVAEIATFANHQAGLRSLKGHVLQLPQIYLFVKFLQHSQVRISNCAICRADKLYNGVLMIVTG
jgi:hypothetical protein